MNHTESFPSSMPATYPSERRDAPIRAAGTFHERMIYAISRIQPLTDEQRAVLFADDGEDEVSGGVDCEPLDK